MFNIIYIPYISHEMPIINISHYDLGKRHGDDAMGCQYQAAGEVALVILLDPRSLLPVEDAGSDGSGNSDEI